MRRQLDSTISIASYLFLGLLALAALSGCGRILGPGTNQGDRTGRVCGYDFDLETSQATLQGQLSILAGLWRDNYTLGYTTVNVGGAQLYERAGFQFDFLKQSYGEIQIRFSSTSPLVEHSVVGPTGGFDTLKISTKLTGYADGTYRVLELHNSQIAANYNSCRTHLFKTIDSNHIVITPGKTHFIAGDGAVPSIDELLETVPNPDTYKFIRQ
jgi:hypothetical protein